VIADFLAAKRDEGRYSEGTLKIFAGWLERCQKYFAPKPLNSLRQRDLEDWRQSLSWVPGPGGKLYAENTVNQAVGTVRLFYRWALAAKLVREDPSSSLRTRRLPKQPRPSIDARRLLALLDGNDYLAVRDRALYGLLVEAEFPSMACARLDLKDLQIDTGALLVGGRRPGIYSLSDGLLADMERYLSYSRPQLALKAAKGEQALFLNRRGRRLSATAIQACLRGYQRQLAKP
jgi:site-specific recombinase XerD